MEKIKTDINTNIDLAKKEATRIYELHYKVMKSPMKFSKEKAIRNSIITCKECIETVGAVAGSHSTLILVCGFWKLVIEQLKKMKAEDL